MKIGVFATPGKERAPALLRQLVEMARAQNIDLRLEHAAAATIERDDLGASMEELAAADSLIVLGGDGAVLSAARAAASHHTPILSVDLGRLGFLSAVRPDELANAFDLLVKGGFEIEERMMLDARVFRGSEFQVSSFGLGNANQLETRNSKLGTDVGGGIGLNDAVVAKSAIARILKLSIFVEGDLVAEMRADGLIISTPSGSTAYALSAGGPIVHPAVPLLLICPICAHSLTQRPFIVGPDEVVEVRADWEGDEVAPGVLEAMLTIDGQIGVVLQPGDMVRVRRSPHTARLLRHPTEIFYDRLRQKMSWE